MDYIFFGAIGIVAIVALFVGSAAIIEYPAISFLVIAIAIVVGVAIRKYYKNHKEEEKIKKKVSIEREVVDISKELMNDELTIRIANDICGDISGKLSRAIHNPVASQSERYIVFKVTINVTNRSLYTSTSGSYSFELYRRPDLTEEKERKALASAVADLVNNKLIRYKDKGVIFERNSVSHPYPASNSLEILTYKVLNQNYKEITAWSHKR